MTKVFEAITVESDENPDSDDIRARAVSGGKAKQR